MPNIESLPVPLYTALMPYHHVADNEPIIGLIQQILVVNNAVDLNTAILDQSIGTQGTLANRLAQSINDDGSLKTFAIDNALHSIADHLDGGGYVRMTLAERAKLSFIAADATSFQLNVQTISGIIPFIDTVVNLGPSDSIVWGYDGYTLSAMTNFPAAVRHTHYYGYNGITSDWLNYKVTTLSTPYRSGSLRVYINGIRLNTSSLTYVPLTSATWVPFSYTEGTATGGIVTGGDFQLSLTIPSAYRSSTSVIVDFDILY